jgi:hypothetical protein
MNAAPMAQIIGALPDAIRKSDVRAWIERHTNVKVSATIVKGVLSVKAVMVGHNDAEYKHSLDLAKAFADPFWKKVKAQDTEAMLGLNDVAAMLARVVAKVEKAKNEGKLALSAEDMAALDSVSAASKGLSERAKATAKA